MTSNCNYCFIRISKTEGLEESAAKYRTLRLQGLQASPTSFSSTYEIEAAFTTADWIDRLSAPGRENFICVAKAPSNKNNDEGEWIGQVTLRGPFSKSDFLLAKEAGQLLGKADEEERWQLLSLFILPGHRGAGLGGTLCRKALNYLQSYQSSPDKVHVRLMIKAGNQVAAKLYEHLGFMHSGKCTLAEALVANGDGHLLPTDTSSPKVCVTVGTEPDLGWPSLSYDRDLTNYVVLTGSEELGYYSSVNPPVSWMQELLPVIGDRKLKQICMPGLHDSGMSELTLANTLANEGNTHNQYLDIYGQLLRAARAGSTSAHVLVATKARLPATCELVIFNISNEAGFTMGINEAWFPNMKDTDWTPILNKFKNNIQKLC